MPERQVVVALRTMEAPHADPHACECKRNTGEFFTCLLVDAQSDNIFVFPLPEEPDGAALELDTRVKAVTDVLIDTKISMPPVQHQIVMF